MGQQQRVGQSTARKKKPNTKGVDVCVCVWLFSALVFVCVCIGNVHVCVGGGGREKGVAWGRGWRGVDNGGGGLGALSSLIAS